MTKEIALKILLTYDGKGIKEKEKSIKFILLNEKIEIFKRFVYFYDSEVRELEKQLENYNE